MNLMTFWLYRAEPAKTLFFLFLRLLLTPYKKMAACLPTKGKVLDLAAGHGLLTLALAVDCPTRQVVGVDHDAERIRAAQRAASHLSNVTLISSDMDSFLNSWSDGSFAGIAVIDSMHYIDFAQQVALFKKLHGLLESGGLLIIREIDPEGGMSARFNTFYESLVVKIGFTKTRLNTNPLYIRKREDWIATLTSAGFSVTAEKFGSRLFSDVLYTCRKS